jgi:prolyl oligopeptidase
MSVQFARVDSEEDSLAGLSFPDPYRWLEHDTEETRCWQRAQALHASKVVREWRYFGRLRDWVARFNIPPRITLPRYTGGHWFRVHMREDSHEAQVRVSDDLVSPGRLLFDAKGVDATTPPYVSWISPSPDGRTLAIGVCVDGSENNRIHLLDVGTGEAFEDAPSQTLMDNWTGGAQWLPDSSGFFFSGIEGAPTEFRQNVYLHRRLPEARTIALDIPWTTLKDWRMVIVSRDAKYAVAIERLTSPIPVAIAALDRDDLQWQPFVTSIAGTVAGHVIGDHYVAVTDVDAPRGRLVRIPLHAQDPNDSQSWQELVAESTAVLRTVTPVARQLYLTEYVDTYAQVRVVDRDGRHLEDVPLPGRGAISELPFPMMNLFPKGHPEHFLFGFSSFVSSWATYSHQPGKSGLDVLSEPKVRLDNIVVEDRWVKSSDGARIPYHVVRCSDVSADQSRPTLLYAYGGFNVPLVPQFPGPMAAFVAAGGVFVHAHLRGGAEFGLDWWRGGRLERKENCFLDLYAVAEDLVAAQICTKESLALTGGSNGGLLAGVALTQRPELWRVVVPRVPMLDLIGACREPYGRMCVSMEYADITNPDEVRRLVGFSPYHLIRDGVIYPAVFLDCGATDPRCPPWHARKFAARLQRASPQGGAPVLLHVWENAGHGWATDPRVTIEQYSEWLAFVCIQLGIEPVRDIIGNESDNACESGYGNGEAH